MSVILSSAQALFQSIGSTLTSAREQVKSFALWLFGMEPAPIDANLGAKISRQLTEMAGILEERKTSWISLTVLFGEHKKAAHKVAQTLSEIEQKIHAIYANKKKTDDLSAEEQRIVTEIARSLRSHISTLQEIKATFPQQYCEIDAQVAKITEHAHHLLLNADEIASITGDPKIAAAKIVASFTQFSEEADAVYKAYQGASALPKEANHQLDQIRQRVRNHLGIVRDLQQNHPTIYADITPQLRLVKALFASYTGLPHYSDEEVLTVAMLNTLPLYGRMQAIEDRLTHIRGELNQAMGSVQEAASENAALLAHDELTHTPQPISISKGVERMIQEAKRLVLYHKDIVAAQIYDAGRVVELWQRDDGATTPLATSIAFFEQHLARHKAAAGESAAVDGLIEDARNYVVDTATQAASRITNVAWSFLLGLSS